MTLFPPQSILHPLQNAVRTGKPALHRLQTPIGYGKPHFATSAKP